MNADQLKVELKKTRVYGQIMAKLGLTEELHISENHPQLETFKRMAAAYDIPVVANGHVPGKDLWLVRK
jgi:hypothetical protein